MACAFHDSDVAFPMTETIADATLAFAKHAAKHRAAHKAPLARGAPLPRSFSGASARRARVSAAARARRGEARRGRRGASRSSARGGSFCVSHAWRTMAVERPSCRLLLRTAGEHAGRLGELVARPEVVDVALGRQSCPRRRRRSACAARGGERPFTSSLPQRRRPREPPRLDGARHRSGRCRPRRPGRRRGQGRRPGWVLERPRGAPSFPYGARSWPCGVRRQCKVAAKSSKPKVCRKAHEDRRVRAKVARRGGDPSRGSLANPPASHTRVSKPPCKWASAATSPAYTTCGRFCETRWRLGLARREVLLVRRVSYTWPLYCGPRRLRRAVRGLHFDAGVGAVLAQTTRRRSSRARRRSRRARPRRRGAPSRRRRLEARAAAGPGRSAAA